MRAESFLHKSLALSVTTTTLTAVRTPLIESQGLRYSHSILKSDSMYNLTFNIQPKGTHLTHIAAAEQFPPNVLRDKALTALEPSRIWRLASYSEDKSVSEGLAATIFSVLVVQEDSLPTQNLLRQHRQRMSLRSREREKDIYMFYLTTLSSATTI